MPYNTKECLRHHAEAIRFRVVSDADISVERGRVDKIAGIGADSIVSSLMVSIGKRRTRHWK